MARNLSFISANHPIHSKNYIVDITNQGKKCNHCLSCLIDMTENLSTSKVQRHVVIGLLNSALENDETVLLMASQSSDNCQLISLVLDIYTDDLTRQTAASLCANLIHKLQDENLYQIFMEKFHTSVLSMPSCESLKLHLLVLSLLLGSSRMYSEMIIMSNAKTIICILDIYRYMDESTLNLFIQLVAQLIESINSSPLLQSDGTELFVWKVFEVFSIWINTLQTYNLMLSCLIKLYVLKIKKIQPISSSLFKECLKSEVLATGLILASHEYNVLMGLKRILATKETILIVNGTHCLSLLIETLKDLALIKKIFDSDVGEFIFEFLHTAYIPQLESALQCLLVMARHSLFYEKCHAVYGLDSLLKATNEALIGRKFAVVDKCLTLLICFLERQPETIPLFINQSWNLCCQLLLDCLQKDTNAVTLKALKAVIVFFRPQHLQCPVNLNFVSSICISVERVFQMFFISISKEHQSSNILMVVCEFIISLDRILQCNETLYGNVTETVTEVNALLTHLCNKWIMLIINDYWDFVRDDVKLKNFMHCMDILLRKCHHDTGAAVKIFCTGFPFHVIALSSELQLAGDAQKLVCQALTSLCLQLITVVKPSIDINPSTLLNGLTFLKWHDGSSMMNHLQELKSHEEIIAFFSLVYLSYFFGYQCWLNFELESFLDIMQSQYSGLLALDKIVARAYVYLAAFNQSENSITNEIDESTVLTQLEKFPIEYWFTSNVRVYKWSLFTQKRTKALGSKLVEFWILNLKISSPPSETVLSRIDEADKSVLQALMCNQHFLFSAINLLDTDNLATAAEEILIHCLSQMSMLSADKELSSVMESLFHHVLHKFNSEMVQSLTLKESTLKRYLSLLCTMMTSHLCSAVDRSYCLKPLYHVLKLLLTDVNDLVACSIQFISSVVVNLSQEDSKTVIPLMFKNENFASSIEFYIENKIPVVSQHALVIAGWLATYGKHYQPSHPVVISSRHLLDYLVSCKAACLPTLQLIHAVLTDMVDKSSHGAVRFVKAEYNFILAGSYSFHELQQIYIYLQQLLLLKNEKNRLLAVCCIEKLLTLGHDISQHLLQQPWNSLMLEIMFSSCEDELSLAELDVCLLLSYNLNVWTSTVANSFLLKLLNSNISDDLQHKAKVILEQMKLSKTVVDRELFETVEECLAI